MDKMKRKARGIENFIDKFFVGVEETARDSSLLCFF